MKKILLIDDNKDIVKVLVYQFVKMGYEILVAYDGVEGLEIISKKNDELGLILTDIDMPRMDGLELIENLKDNSVPILVYSGLACKYRYLQDQYKFVKKVLEKPQSYEQFQSVISEYFAY